MNRHRDIIEHRAKLRALRKRAKARTRRRAK